MLGFPALKISTKNTTQMKHWKMELVDMGGKMVGYFCLLKKTCLCVIVEQQISIGRRKKRIQELNVTPPNTHPKTSYLQTQTSKMQ